MTARFGVSLGLSNKPLSQLYEEVQLVEELGFDHCWLNDHLMPPGGPTDGPCLEAWTVLAAVAARTSHIRIGILVTSNTFRHPVVLLKEAVTVDHISGGRLNIGIGSGWHKEEHRRYGIELFEPGERVDRFAEAVEVMRLLMTQERTTYNGRHYRLDDAPLQPRPLQRPHIPILIAAHRPRMLRIAARFADIWDSYVTIPGSANDGLETDLAQRVAYLDNACRAIGRDPIEIRRSTWGTRDALKSEDAYLDFVRRHERLGFTDFSTVLPAPEDMPVFRRVATRVIPELRAEAARA